MHFNIKKRILILFLFTWASLNSTEYLGYISPGISFGINSSGKVFVDGKISIGMTQYREVNNTYIKYHTAAFTVGFNALIRNEVKINFEKEYNYFLVQYGTSTLPEYFIMSGVGIGRIFKVTDKHRGIPLIRLYIGAVIFSEFDMLFISKNKILKNYGVRGILPLPIYSSTRLFFGTNG